MLTAQKNFTFRMSGMLYVLYVCCMLVSLVVESKKLVGYRISSDLNTKSSTTAIIAWALKWMLIIQRPKALGGSEADLLNVLRCQVLSVLQFARKP